MCQAVSTGEDREGVWGKVRTGLPVTQMPVVTYWSRCNKNSDTADLCTGDPADHHYKDTLVWSTDPEVNPPFHDFGNSLHYV